MGSTPNGPSMAVDMVLNSNMLSPPTDSLSMAADTLSRAMGLDRRMVLLVATVEDMVADTEGATNNRNRNRNRNLRDTASVQVVRRR